MTDATETLIETSETTIFVRAQGSGPPVLLLHGFPETSVMWRSVASQLAQQFTVVSADLRGYGKSGCPASTPDHFPYSKRALAGDMVAVMERLGFSSFCVAGHDRGGRVGYRMALDHPARVRRLAVLDIVPTSMAWEYADDRFVLAFWPWSLLAQRDPLPERIMTASADAIVDAALDGWSSSPATFSADVRTTYANVLKDRAHAHAICEEYRAAATVDRQHDDDDRASCRRIRCPVLVLWSAEGPLSHWYTDKGGPLTLWQAWSENLQCHAMPGGHFFPEEFPQQTAAMLGSFFPRDSEGSSTMAARRG